VFAWGREENLVKITKPTVISVLVCPNKEAIRRRESEQEEKVPYRSA